MATDTKHTFLILTKYTYFKTKIQYIFTNISYQCGLVYFLKDTFLERTRIMQEFHNHLHLQIKYFRITSAWNIIITLKNKIPHHKKHANMFHWRPKYTFVITSNIKRMKPKNSYILPLTLFKVLHFRWR